MPGHEDIAAAGERLPRSHGHAALLYSGQADFLTSVLEFVREGVRNGEPVLALLPEQSAGALRCELGGLGQDVLLANMGEIGGNPARILPAAQTFAAGRQVRCVWEPAWPGRSDAEVCEIARHEAVSNLALAGGSVTALCPYDAAGLPSPVLEYARDTHPDVIEHGQRAVSSSYLGPARIPAPCRQPLPAPPAAAPQLQYDLDLRPVRDFVSGYASGAGLSEARRADLVLAAGELAANTLRHTAGGGTLQLWQDEHEVLCQVTDNGCIADPLAGFRRLPPDSLGGHGLWLVNQVCDLVEMRSGSRVDGTVDGTMVRLHMRLPATGPAQSASAASASHSPAG